MNKETLDIRELIELMPDWIMSGRYDIVSCINMIYGIKSLCQSKEAEKFRAAIHSFRYFKSFEELRDSASQIVHYLKVKDILGKSIWTIQEEKKGNEQPI